MDTMDAREWFDAAKDDGDVLCLARFGERRGENMCVGRADALVVDDQIAVLLVPCNGPTEDETWPGGTIVHFITSPDFTGDTKYRISGSPASVLPNFPRGPRVPT